MKEKLERIIELQDRVIKIQEEEIRRLEQLSSEKSVLLKEQSELLDQYKRLEEWRTFQRKIQINSYYGTTPVYHRIFNPYIDYIK